jgi:hypothetical protein
MLTFVTSPEGDWLAILNEQGKPVFQGHSIQPRELLELINELTPVNVTAQWKEIPDDDMYMENFSVVETIEPHETIGG